MVDIILAFLSTASLALMLWILSVIRYEEEKLMLITQISSRGANLIHVVRRKWGRLKYRLEIIIDKLADPVVWSAIFVFVLMGACFFVLFFFLTKSFGSELRILILALIMLILSVFIVWRRSGEDSILDLLKEWIEPHTLVFHDPNYDHYKYRTIHYTGDCKLPKKVYEGDSRNIAIDLRPYLEIPKDNAEPIHLQQTKEGTTIILHVSRSNNIKEYLEIELLAAACAVDGEKKQRQELTSNFLRYQWNCHFLNSGNHTLSLVVRITSSSNTMEIDRVEHNYKVVKLDHMTQRQVWVLATLTGGISAILAIMEVVRRLGLF